MTMYLDLRSTQHTAGFTSDFGRAVDELKDAFRRTD